MTECGEEDVCQATESARGVAMTTCSLKVHCVHAAGASGLLIG